MKSAGKRVVLGGFLLWESYWAYVFFSAPMPDEKMDGIFALLMAVFLPLLFVAPVILMRILEPLNRWLASTKRD